MAKQEALKEALAPVKYQATDGTEITLTLEDVKQFLVQGHPEYVTLKEFKYFMSVCQAKKMNPFVHDCYLVKYTRDDPAAIIVSIHFKRRRARKNEDCQGWGKGIIIKRKEEIVYSAGLMLKDDELLGGWFKAKPKNFEDPIEHEVNLEGFVKRTKEGNITRFWSKPNQPMMIAKVAESQGLEIVWPEEGGPLYTDAEIGPGTTEALPPPGEEQAPNPEELERQAEEFDNKIKAEFQDMAKSDEEHLEKFLTYAVASGHYGDSVEKVKACALTAWEDFVNAWQNWSPDKEAA